MKEPCITRGVWDRRTQEHVIVYYLEWIYCLIVNIERYPQSPSIWSGSCYIISKHVMIGQSMVVMVGGVVSYFIRLWIRSIHKSNKMINISYYAHVIIW